MNTHGVCHVYARYIVLKVNYDFLQLSHFNIILSSTVAFKALVQPVPEPR